MLVGIDAHHDPEMRSGSVAVLVATTDKEMAHYVSFCEPQNIHTELFDGLQVCMLKALTRYYKANIQAFFWPPEKKLKGKKLKL